MTGLTREQAAKAVGVLFGSIPYYIGTYYETWGVKDPQGKEWKFTYDSNINGVREEMRRMAANPLIRSMFPSGEQMKAHNIEIGHKRMGTCWMFENNEEDWIKAFFGSREKQKAIKD